MVNDVQVELITAEAKRLSEKYGKDYLDYNDLLKITGLGKNNVRAMMNSFDFPAIKIGRRKVVNVMSFAKWSYSQNSRRKH